MMLALTLIQPWATAIMTLGKDVENRPWAPSPKQLPIGGRFAIHAGMKVSARDREHLTLEMLGEEAVIAKDWIDLPKGVLLGTAELAGFVEVGLPLERHAGAFTGDHDACAKALGSKWRAWDSPFAWAVRNPRLLATPIPCKGALGLWRVPVEHLPALEALQ